MMHTLAALIFLAIIAGLFIADRRAEVRTSIWLWVPILWMIVVGSRPVTFWMPSGPAYVTAEKYAEGSPVDAAIFGALIAGAVLALNWRWRRVRDFLAVNGPMLLFFAYCLFSTTWSDFQVVSFKRWVKAAGDFVMILVVLTEPNRKEAMQRFLSRPAFVLLPMSVLLILFFPDLGTVNTSIGTTYTGVTTNKNSLGVICVVCGLGMLWLWIAAYQDKARRHRRRDLGAYGCMFALAVGLTVRANSMTSLSCLLLGSALMLTSMRPEFWRHRKRLHALVAGAIALPLCAIFLDTAGSLVHALGRETTLTGRTIVWRAVLAVPINFFVGSGFESFWLGDRLRQVWNLSGQMGIQEAHNGYIELYLNLGWMGLMLLGMLAVLGYRRIVDEFRTNPQGGRLRLALFTAGLIYSLTEAGFRMMSPIWIGFLLATTLVPARLREPAREQIAEARRTQTGVSPGVRVLQ